MPDTLVRAAEPRDVPVLLELFAELAEYEHLTHELRATEQGLAGALFGERPVAEALIAERRPPAAGAESDGVERDATSGEDASGEDAEPDTDSGAAEVLGYALFFPTFSSFLTSTGVWLEDLFVRPAHRGEGVGRALLAAVAARVRERGGERLEWAALDWNELALGFYRRMGASAASEWITHRLDGAALERVAWGAPSVGGHDAGAGSNDPSRA